MSSGVVADKSDLTSLGSDADWVDGCRADVVLVEVVTFVEVVALVEVSSALTFQLAANNDAASKMTKRMRLGCRTDLTRT